MDLIYTKKIKSNKNNLFSITILTIENEIDITIKRENENKEIYKQIYTIKDFQKMNKYFNPFKTSKDLINELNKQMDTSLKLFEETENLVLNIILPNSKYNEISMTIKKNKNNSDDIIQSLQQIYFKLENIEKETNNLIDEKNENKKSYKKLEENINTSKLEFKDFNEKLNKLEELFYQYKIKYFNQFHWINNEVEITNSSKYFSDFSPDILLGKNTKKKIFLSDGNKNHFIEFTFKQIYYLIAIRITVSDFNCSLRNFTIDIIGKNNEKGNIGLFTKAKYSNNPEPEIFPIERFCKCIILTLIDNWANGGEYIEITKIDFLVSE